MEREPLTEDQVWDPASQSLSDALQLSLKILKSIMILLVLLFLSSGIFTVNENEEALVLVFGKVRDAKTEPILKSGLHWTWPYPLSEVVKIPTSQQSFEINHFWHEQDEKNKNRVPEMLNPIKDGYCLTGDTNIVHSKWQIRYKVIKPYLYIQRSKESDKLLNESEKVDNLLYNIACSSIVDVTSNFLAQDVIKTNKARWRNQVQSKLEEKLEKLEMGIKLEGVELIDIIPPRQVQKSFESVSEAEREYLQQIEKAQKERTQLVTQSHAEAKKIIQEAIAYRNELEKTARGDANYFKEILKEFGDHPEIFWQRQYQQVMEQIPDKVQEIFLFREYPRELQFRLNRNPKLYKVRPAREE